jgi:hypothetical protein
MIHKIELLKVKITVTKVIINAQNIYKDQSVKILQTKDILYIKEAQSIISDKLDLKNLRQKTCNEHIKKQYIKKLIKIYKRCKIHIKI